jgi:hypothetical protein
MDQVNQHIQRGVQAMCESQNGTPYDMLRLYRDEASRMLLTEQIRMKFRSRITHAKCW